MFRVTPVVGKLTHSLEPVPGIRHLLQIEDPNNLGGFGPVFRFPFQTIESVIPLGSRRLGILDDNNYPFSSARNPGQPDPNEFIIIKLNRPVVQFARPGWHEKDDEKGGTDEPEVRR